jgi:quinol monooxygenase YgiN
VIRSVVLVKFKPDARPGQLAELERALKAVRFEGCTRWEMAKDLGLRDGNMSHAFVSEFVDEAAYRAYDSHPEHNRIRRELLAPIVEKVERFQYEVE